MSNTVFVLIPGSWNQAPCYAKTQVALTAAGYNSVAITLPGHGVIAPVPASYNVRPLNPGNFATEPSPVAGVSLASYISAVEPTILSLKAQGKKVVLVGHSMAGIILNALGEKLGKSKIDRLIYLSAFLPANNQPLGAIIQSPNQASSLVPSTFLADPNLVGALRIDPRSSDATYKAKLKAAFYGDATTADFNAALLTLTPDDPAQVFGTPVAITAAKWGQIPRSYLRCLNDKAILPATQIAMIAAADAFAGNLTRVNFTNSDHSPFVNRPSFLAANLIGLAI